MLNLGSNARGEMTLYSDQDNALILEHSEESPPYDWQEYFRELSSRFCAVLNQAGFPYCPGGIMAVNPPWRMTLNAWKKSIRQWVQRSEFKDIMYLNVLADMEFISGKNVLYKELQQEIRLRIEEHPEFLSRFASYCLEQPLPVNGIGQLLPDTKEGRKIIHIKNCLKVLEGAARVLAVEEQIPHLGTAERFRNSTLHQNTVADAVSAFDRLWRFRFKTQTAAYQGIRRVDDQLDLQTLEQNEIKELTQAVQNTRLVQKALKFRYFGREV